MLKVGLVNDTRTTANPGCMAVYQAIEGLIVESGGRIAASLPVNYWAEPFKSIAATSRDCVTRRPNSFPAGTEQAPVVDQTAWHAIASQLASSDSLLVDFVRSSDIVVVNGEGSIHHNYPRALALLALIKIIGKHHRPLVLVNSTIQAMQAEILQSALPGAYLHVREDSTRDFLASLGIQSRSAPDLAFRSIAALPLESKQEDYGDGCLVTAGVLAGRSALRNMFHSIRRLGLEPTYLCIGDGGEEASIDRVCQEEGVLVAHAREFPLRSLLEYLSRFRLAVSGRHHINIFLMRAEVPFVPLPSNTWKIEATLRKVSYPLPVVKQLDELSTQLRAASADRAALRQACARSFACGSRDVEAVAGEIVKWMC